MRPLLYTDQIHCYSEKGRRIACSDAGHDASYRKRHPLDSRRRFQVLSEVVRDELTGAIWCRNAAPAEFVLTWNEAHAFVADMRTRRAYGYDAWQLPSRGLLFSLVSHQHINPSLPKGHPFDDVFPGYYWTGDTCRRLSDQAWYVHLGGGRIHRGMKHGSYMVWPVCNGCKIAVSRGLSNENRFTAGDVVARDNLTGLTWSKDADPIGRKIDWQQALSAIHAFNRRRPGGHHDWRLPNIRELESLVDLRSHSPALPTGHPFTNVKDAYWSSTSSVYEPRYAWTLYSRDGVVGVGFKPSPDFYVWPVRNS